MQNLRFPLAISILVAAVFALAISLTLNNSNSASIAPTMVQATKPPNVAVMDAPKQIHKTHPLQIHEMRKESFPGSNIEIVETLAPKSSYSQYIASYESEENKIFALLTIPSSDPPEGGFPAIIFNHGYIPPEEYKTEEKYVAYVDGFAREGFVVFKPDYRGHGDSEGEPLGAYYSTAYTADALNAFASVAQMKTVNPKRVGMWGHSMGGHITLRSMVVNENIKAGVIWAGVVASYQDMSSKWTPSTPWKPSPREVATKRPSRQDIIDEFGTIEENPDFWNSIAPINFVDDISGPVQIHHGTGDTTVPWAFSESLNFALTLANKDVEFFSYEGADHNLSGSAFLTALARSAEFFKKHL